MKRAPTDSDRPKMTRHEAAWRGIPILVSLAALAISSAGFYQGSLAPFNPLVTVGTITLHPLRQPEADQTTLPGAQARLAGVMLVVPFSFTQQGGRPGVIEDLIIRAKEGSSGRESLFTPQILVDERVYISTFEPNAQKKWMAGMFYSIPLAKGEQQRRMVMFMPEPNANGDPTPLVAGPYSFRVLMRTSASTDWLEVAVRNETLPQGLIDDLRKGVVWSPTPSAVIEARKRAR